MGRKASSVAKPPQGTPCAMHPACPRPAYGYVSHQTLGSVASCVHCAHVLGAVFILKE